MTKEYNNSKVDLETIGQQLWDLGLWECFHSDIVLEVSTIITEPVCPEAILRFELPERAGMGFIARAHGNTIDEAITNVINKALIVLKQIIENKKKEN